MLPTINITLHSKKDKNGFSFVMIRVTYERKHYHISTGLKSTSNEFSDGEFKNSVDNAVYKNRKIKKEYAEIEKQILIAEEEGRISEAFLVSITSNNSSKENVEDILNKTIEAFKGKYSKGYIKQLTSTKSKLLKYKPDLKLSEVTPEFMHRFESHMYNALGNERNTVSGTTKRVCALFTKASSDKLKLIPRDPLANYHPETYRQTKRDFVPDDNLKLIEDFIESTTNEYLKNIAIWFMFGVYSAHRYLDMGRLNEATITDNELYFADHKTQTPHSVPLSNKLKKYLGLVKGMVLYENQPMNRGLKEIANILNLSVKPTMHMARHTFSVRWLSHGGSIEKLQVILGHSKIVTTQIYSKITNKSLNEEAQRVYMSQGDNG